MGIRRFLRPGSRIVVAWAVLLTATVSLGVLGQTEQERTDPPASGAAIVAPSASATVAPTPRRPHATRPPIGEDGVMGGRVFGTAFGWLDPAPSSPPGPTDP